MVKREKRLIILTLLVALLVAAVAVPTSSFFTYAAEGENGFKLADDYQVKITYSSVTQFASGIHFAYEVVFDDDFYLPLSGKRELMNKVKETFVNNGFSVETDDPNGKMTATMKFDTITDYYIAIGEDGYKEGEKTEPDRKTFFYDYYSSSFRTVFADLKTEGRYVNRIYKVCSEAGISDEKMLLCFVYGTPYGEGRITSDASSVRYSSVEKVYYHTFLFNVDERDKEITIYRKTPNTIAWYSLAIAFGLIVLALPLSIAIAKRKKERKNG